MSHIMQMIEHLVNLAEEYGSIKATDPTSYRLNILSDKAKAVFNDIKREIAPTYTYPLNAGIKSYKDFMELLGLEVEEIRNPPPIEIEFSLK